MLVLSRTEGESIFIGDEIKITVLRTGREIKIGIDAPKKYTILRDDTVNRGQGNV